MTWDLAQSLYDKHSVIINRIITLPRFDDYVVERDKNEKSFEYGNSLTQTREILMSYILNIYNLFYIPIILLTDINVISLSVQFILLLALVYTWYKHKEYKKCKELFKEL